METSLQQFITERGLTYRIDTYGCQMNAHDSEKIAGILESIGYKAAPDEDADLVIFNTCCVRDHAEKRIFGNVGALKKKKLRRKHMVIAVCGCMMQQEDVAKKLADTFPFVNIVFGTHNMHELPEMLYAALIHRKRSLRVGNDENAPIEDVPMRRNSPPLSFVNIMQGCNNFCTYCIVPYVRGRERSRAPQDVINEVAGLAEAGFKEVMLLGQNVNSYGKGGEIDFPALLRRIARETGMQRIRFMTSHPKDLSEELLRVIAEESAVCKQLHLPVQSGSDRILDLMNRRYTREHYLGLIKKAREAMPGITLSTDVIVGFPGETEAEFQDTLSLMQEVAFDSAYTFVYSPRTGTKAAEFADQIPEEVKQSRIVRLVDLQNEITFNKNKACEGRVEEVLVEGVSKRDEHEVCGRTDGGRMVNFPGDASLTGSIITVKITQGKRTTLFGERL